MSEVPPPQADPAHFARAYLPPQQAATAPSSPTSPQIGQVPEHPAPRVRIDQASSSFPLPSTTSTFTPSSTSSSLSSSASSREPATPVSLRGSTLPSSHLLVPNAPLSANAPLSTMASLIATSAAPATTTHASEPSTVLPSSPAVPSLPPPPSSETPPLLSPNTNAASTVVTAGSSTPESQSKHPPPGVAVGVSFTASDGLSQNLATSVIRRAAKVGSHAEQSGAPMCAAVADSALPTRTNIAALAESRASASLQGALVGSSSAGTSSANRSTDASRASTSGSTSNAARGSASARGAIAPAELSSSPQPMDTSSSAAHKRKRSELSGGSDSKTSEEVIAPNERPRSKIKKLQQSARGNYKCRHAECTHTHKRDDGALARYSYYDHSVRYKHERHLSSHPCCSVGPDGMENLCKLGKDIRRRGKERKLQPMLRREDRSLPCRHLVCTSTEMFSTMAARWCHETEHIHDCDDRCKVCKRVRHLLEKRGQKSGFIPLKKSADPPQITPVERQERVRNALLRGLRDWSRYWRNASNEEWDRLLLGTLPSQQTAYLSFQPYLSQLTAQAVGTSLLPSATRATAAAAAAAAAAAVMSSSAPPTASSEIYVPSQPAPALAPPSVVASAASSDSPSTASLPFGSSTPPLDQPPPVPTDAAVPPPSTPSMASTVSSPSSSPSSLSSSSSSSSSSSAVSAPPPDAAPTCSTANSLPPIVSTTGAQTPSSAKNVPARVLTPIVPRKSGSAIGSGAAVGDASTSALPAASSPAPALPANLKAMRSRGSSTALPSSLRVSSPAYPEIGRALSHELEQGSGRSRGRVLATASSRRTLGLHSRHQSASSASLLGGRSVSSSAGSAVDLTRARLAREPSHAEVVMRGLRLVAGSVTGGETSRLDIRKILQKAIANLILLVGLGGAVLLYFVFEQFVRPLLWALLVGACLYPIKHKWTKAMRGWLHHLGSTDTPILWGMAVLPLKLPRWIVDFVLDRWERIAVVCCLIGFLALFEPIHLVVRWVVMKIIFLLATLSSLLDGSVHAVYKFTDTVYTLHLGIPLLCTYLVLAISLCYYNHLNLFRVLNVLSVILVSVASYPLLMDRVGPVVLFAFIGLAIFTWLYGVYSQRHRHSEETLSDACTSIARHRSAAGTSPNEQVTLLFMACVMVALLQVLPWLVLWVGIALLVEQLFERLIYETLHQRVSALLDHLLERELSAQREQRRSAREAAASDAHRAINDMDDEADDKEADDEEQHHEQDAVDHGDPRSRPAAEQSSSSSWAEPDHTGKLKKTLRKHNARKRSAAQTAADPRAQARSFSHAGQLQAPSARSGGGVAGSSRSKQQRNKSSSKSSKSKNKSKSVSMVEPASRSRTAGGGDVTAAPNSRQALSGAAQQSRGRYKLARVLLPSVVYRVWVAYLEGDRRLRADVSERTGTLVTILLLLMLVLGSVFVLLFVLVQVNSESMEIYTTSQEVWQSTARHEASRLWKQLTGQNFEKQLAQATNHTVDFFYDTTREWIHAKVHNITNGDIDVYELERNITRLWEGSFAKDESLPVSNLTSKWAQVQHDFKDTFSKFHDPWSFVNENVELIRAISLQVWSQFNKFKDVIIQVVWMIASLLWSTSQHVMGFFFSGAVFLTALSYLLVHSTDTYVPYTWFAGLFGEIGVTPAQDHSASDSDEEEESTDEDPETTDYEDEEDDEEDVSNETLRRQHELTEVISKVVESTLMISLFHGLVCWLTFTLFGVSVVWIPSLFAAAFGMSRLVDPVLVAVPICLKFWWLDDDPVRAIVLALVHLVASWYFAPQFYANIPGENSLYVIGLSALGGLYFLGIEGAVFGPLVVSIWLLCMKELRNKIAAAEQMHSNIKAPGS